MIKDDHVDRRRKKITRTYLNEHQLHRFDIGYVCTYIWDCDVVGGHTSMPKIPLSCETEMVMAAAEVKPAITGPDMKSIRKPGGRGAPQRHKGRGFETHERHLFSDDC